MKKTSLLILAVIIIGQYNFAQTENYKLQIDEKIDKTILLDDSHSYQLKLDKNQFALLNLKQNGIDLKITTIAPNGNKIEEFDSPNGSDGNEIILIDSDASGLFQIVISTLGEVKKEKKGNYEIELIAINSSVKKHLDEVLNNLYSRQHIPGFGVGIVNSEKTLYHNGYGYANINAKTPYTSETVQSVASISKTFIGLSILTLVDQNKITLDTPINDILPFKVTNPYFPNTPITIRHLATHTATINEDSFYNKAYIVLDKEAQNKYSYKKYFLKELNNAKKNKKMPMADFLETHLSVDGNNYTKKNFFKAKPGENWYYSNSGASLAAYIVEIVSGVSYDEYVINNIVKPLQLESACWTGEISDNYILSEQYDIDGNPLPKRTIITYPDGEMYINISDLNKYLITFIKGNIGESNFISKNSFSEMMKVQHEQKTGDFKGRKDGLFWEFSKSGVMGHSGGDFGVSAFMYLNPNTNLGFTFTCNIMPNESDYCNTESRTIWTVVKRYATYFNTKN